MFWQSLPNSFGHNLWHFGISIYVQQRNLVLAILHFIGHMHVIYIHVHSYLTTLYAETHLSYLFLAIFYWIYKDTLSTSSIFGHVFIRFQLNYQINVYTVLIVAYVKPLMFPDVLTHRFEYHSAYYSKLCAMCSKNYDLITNAQQALIIIACIAKNVQLDGASWKWCQ